MSEARRGRPRRGLEGVVAGVSSVCYVDGAGGRLFYRGYDVGALAAGATVEEVAYLLWHGDLPAGPALQALRTDLVRAGTLPAPVVDLLVRLPAEAPPMAVLRTAASALAHADPEAEVRAPDADLRKAVRLTAQVAAVVAAFHRRRSGRPILVPDPGLGHAANYLYLLHGTVPSAADARAMDAALVLHADHEFNTSTFAARVTAATLSDLHSAVVSAVATLKGPLHGGASEEVMRLLERIASGVSPEEAVAALLARGGRVPGFGHRVYRTEDPRARVLRPLARAAGERAGDPRWYDLACRVEEVVTALRPSLYPNVDLYAAPLYRALGIPPDLYAATFAVGRVVGWTAHILEQYADNRLIRPLAEYVGPPERPFVPLEERAETPSPD